MACLVSGAYRFSHVTPTFYSLSTGFLLNNKSCSKPWYSFGSASPLASQSTLPIICLYIHLLLKQNLAIQKICFSRFLFTALQFINPKFNSTSASHIMLQNPGMICHWKVKQLPHFHVSKGDLKLICFRSLSLPRFSN